MLAEVSIVPLDKGVHLSSYVAQMLDIIDMSGLEYRLTAMGTIVEGGWDDVMGLIRRCHERMAQESERVETIIRIDDHRGKSGRISGKVESVEKVLGKRLKK
jgi:uncharacterized protein (TIGR00106 family)